MRVSEQRAGEAGMKRTFKAAAYRLDRRVSSMQISPLLSRHVMSPSIRKMQQAQSFQDWLRMRVKDLKSCEIVLRLCSRRASTQRCVASAVISIGSHPDSQGSRSDAEPRYTRILETLPLSLATMYSNSSPRKGQSRLDVATQPRVSAVGPLR